VGNDLASIAQRYEKMTKVEHKYFEALRMIYKKVNDSLSSRLAIKTKSNILLDNLGQGITYYATLNEENVQLVQLDNREAKVYQFTNVSEKIKEYRKKAYEKRKNKILEETNLNKNH
jgi:rubrerythrin